MQKIDPDEILSIKISPIHGLGVFAVKTIPPGKFISVISGEIITTHEALRRESDEENFFIFWNGDFCIDTRCSDKIKFINHDCIPNCTVEEYNDLYLALYSIRTINTYEEITIDYGYDEIYENCRCSHCIKV